MTMLYVLVVWLGLNLLVLALVTRATRERRVWWNISERKFGSNGRRLAASRQL